MANIPQHVLDQWKAKAAEKKIQAQSAMLKYCSVDRILGLCDYVEEELGIHHELTDERLCYLKRASEEQINALLSRIRSKPATLPVPGRLRYRNVRLFRYRFIEALLIELVGSKTAGKYFRSVKNMYSEADLQQEHLTVFNY